MGRKLWGLWANRRDTTSRRTSADAHPFERSLRLEPLEDRRLLAMSVVTVPYVVANPSIAHPAHEDAQITLKAIVRGATSGDSVRVQWDTNNDGTWDSTATYTADSTGTIRDVGRTFLVPQVTGNTLLTPTVQAQNLTHPSYSSATYPVLVWDFRPSNDPRLWTSEQTDVIRAMAVDETLWYTHRQLVGLSGTGAQVQGYLSTPNGSPFYAGITANAVQLFASNGHAPAYSPGTYSGSVPSSDPNWAVHNDYRWNSDPYADTVMRMTNYLVAMVNTTVSGISAFEGNDGRTPIPGTDDNTGLYVANSQMGGDGGQNGAQGAGARCNRKRIVHDGGHTDSSAIATCIRAYLGVSDPADGRRPQLHPE